MNYEELKGKLAPVEKVIKDAASAATRQQKNLQKNEDLGSVTDMKKSWPLWKKRFLCCRLV